MFYTGKEKFMWCDWLINTRMYANWLKLDSNTWVVDNFTLCNSPFKQRGGEIVAVTQFVKSDYSETKKLEYWIPTIANSGSHD